jgi:glycosyltransferase involved in cell wall biosynthesis
MKICIVSLNIVPFFDGDSGKQFGGAETQAAFVAGALRLAGHDVTMVVSDLKDPSRVPYPAENAFDSDDGVPGLRFFYPRWTGIMNALGRADADVYYQRNAGMITGLTAIFCRKHGRVFVYGAGSDTDFSPRDVRIQGLRDRTLFAYGLRTSRGFVVQNQRQAEAAGRRFDTPIRLIPNGVVPVEHARPVVTGKVAWIGALREIKRPDIVLEIARRLPDVHFTIVGSGLSGEPEMPRRIELEAAGLGNVELTGRLPHSRVSDVLAGTSLLLNTSFVEGFPNTYLEAWNHGVPVVTFNDVDDLIRQSGAGRVCGSVDDMVEAIRTIANDPETLRDMATRARHVIRERFYPETLGATYVEFFQSLTSGCVRARPPL